MRGRVLIIAAAAVAVAMIHQNQRRILIRMRLNYEIINIISSFFDFFNKKKKTKGVRLLS